MKPTRYLVTKLAGGAMREQIAGVVIHWNILELQVEWIISNLRGNPGEVKYEEDLVRRLELLKRLSKQKLPPDRAAEMSEISGEIKTLSRGRNRVVHGLWGMDQSGKIISIFPRYKSGARDKPMNAEDVRQIKLRTWRVTRRLMNFEL